MNRPSMYEASFALLKDLLAVVRGDPRPYGTWASNEHPRTRRPSDRERLAAIDHLERCGYIAKQRSRAKLAHEAMKLAALSPEQLEHRYLNAYSNAIAPGMLEKAEAELERRVAAADAELAKRGSSAPGPQVPR
jgi:hypothetical protein